MHTQTHIKIPIKEAITLIHQNLSQSQYIQIWEN